MGDQGAGGGIDSGFLPGHERQKSNNETVPSETGVETRSPPVVQQGDQTEFTQPNQGGFPRHFSGREPPTSIRTRTAPVPPEHGEHGGLGRDSSSYSTQPMLPRPFSFHRRRPEPPVTRATLSELDVTKIIHNPKLRHDINFDPELHFRPNLDGEKGRRKQDKANEFWSALQEQLVQFVMDHDEFYKKYGCDEWCLPALLKAVKEIIQTLVPARDRSFLDEGLNVELLMQQFNRGIVDLEKLASWLSAVLKQHCAPMRDEWVDDIYNDLSTGNRTNNMGQLVKGMRSLLSVLEAMKLDVANHQIRCLRPMLIEDTVHFEQRFFHKKIQTGKLDISPAKRWYDEAKEDVLAQAPLRQAHAFGEMDVFFGGLCKLLLPSTNISAQPSTSQTFPSPAASSKVPSTFLFDEERLLKLRSDVLDAINLEICMRVFEMAEHPAMAFTASVPEYVADDEHNRSNLRTSIGSDLGNYMAASSSRPSSLVFGSPHSSPRNSGLFTQQPVDFVEAKMKSRNLYSSLLALLHTASPAACPARRWASLTPSIAVQIFRFLSAPPSAIVGIERSLEAAFRLDSRLHRQVEETFLERLRAELAIRVKEFKNLSGIGLFSVATGGRIHGPSRNWENQRQRDSLDGSASGRDAREEGGVEDIATRLAHLGILHWRVWAQLAYLDGDSAAPFDVESPTTA